MKLSLHFSLHEATYSQTAEQRGIDNRPNEAELGVLRETALHMEHVRVALGGHPVIVSSWFRCDALNRAVGGVSNSAHRLGWAVDFICPQYGEVFEVASAIVKAGIRFDQLIYEYGRWVHISFAPSMRNEVLMAKAGGYTHGLGK